MRHRDRDGGMVKYECKHVWSVNINEAKRSEAKGGRKGGGGGAVFAGWAVHKCTDVRWVRAPNRNALW